MEELRLAQDEDSTFGSQHASLSKIANEGMTRSGQWCETTACIIGTNGCYQRLSRFA